MDSTVQLRVDSKTKRAVTRIFKALGFDLSTGIKIFFQQVIRCKGIPFQVTEDDDHLPKKMDKRLM